MQTIHLVELQNQIEAMIEKVVAERCEYLIEDQEQPLTYLLPISLSAPLEATIAAPTIGNHSAQWNEMDDLRKAIGEAWQSGLNAAEAVAEQRR